MSVGKDLANSVAVFHWRTRTTLFTAPSGPEAVLGCHVVNENIFVSCGLDHLQLWTRTGGTFERERGECPSKTLQKMTIPCGGHMVAKRNVEIQLIDWISVHTSSPGGTKNPVNGFHATGLFFWGRFMLAPALIMLVIAHIIPVCYLNVP